MKAIERYIRNSVVCQRCASAIYEACSLERFDGGQIRKDTEG